MRRYLSIIWQVFPWYMHQIFVNKFNFTSGVDLPIKIKEYTFVKSLSPKTYPFATGLYKTKTGKEVVIKIWQSDKKNIYYFNLLHQIEMMKVLTKAQNRMSKVEINDFRIPKYINSYKKSNQIILIMEKMDGKPMENFHNANARFTIYKKCLKFLANLSRKLTPQEKIIVTTKSVWDFMLLYPLILLTAIALQPDQMFTLLKGVKTFLEGIPELVKMKPDTLVHGDIHPDNILIASSHDFSLIDVENMRLCYAVYEPITTNSLKGNEQDFKNLVTKNLIKGYKSKASAALIVNNATHNMSGDKNPAGVRSYRQAFKLAFQI